DIPHTGIYDPWVTRIQYEIGSGRCIRDIKDFFPVLPSIGRFEDPPLFVRLPKIPHCSDIHRIVVLGMNADPADMLAGVQADFYPAQACIHRFPATPSTRYISPYRLFTFTNIDDVRIVFRYRHRTDGTPKITIRNTLP